MVGYLINDIFGGKMVEYLPIFGNLVTEKASGPFALQNTN